VKVEDNQGRLILPDGQITASPVQSLREKYFAGAVGQITGTGSRVYSTEGRAHVTNAGWDAVDANGARDVRAERGRQSRVVLTPRRWRQVPGKRSFSGATVARKPGHRGELGISRKTIAQGRPDVSAEPVCSCAFLLAHIARETAGAARTRSSLPPLIFQMAG
jgi:hypothetical protein